MFDGFKPEEGRVGGKRRDGEVPFSDDDTLRYQGGPLHGQPVEVDNDLLMADEVPVKRVWHADHEIVFIDQYNNRATYGDLFNTRVKALPHVYSLGRDGRWHHWQNTEGQSWNLQGRVAFGH